MKSSIMKKMIGLIAVLLVLTTTIFVANAVQPRYVKIQSLSADLQSISLAGRATCNSSVIVPDAACSVTIIAELQQSSDGNTWDTIKTWSDSGCYAAETDGYWYVDKGYEYRVLATATVYNSSGDIVETASTTSLVREY